MIAAKEQEDGWWEVSFKYDPDIVATIKSVPHYGRSYSPAKKSWRISDYWWASTSAALKKQGFKLFESPIEKQTPVNEAWAAALFNRLPDRLHDAAWKAMMIVCHPDKGGDTLITQELNNARDRAKKK